MARFEESDRYHREGRKWMPQPKNRSSKLYSEGDAWTYLAELCIPATEAEKDSGRRKGISCAQLRLLVELLHTFVVGWYRKGAGGKDEKMVIAQGIPKHEKNLPKVQIEEMRGPAKKAIKNLEAHVQRPIDYVIPVDEFCKLVRPLLKTIEDVHGRLQKREKMSDSGSDDGSRSDTSLESELPELPWFSRAHIYGSIQGDEEDFTISPIARPRIKNFEDEEYFYISIVVCFWVTQYLRKKLEFDKSKTFHFMDLHNGIVRLVENLKKADLSERILRLDVDEEDEKLLKKVKSISFVRNGTCSEIFTKWNAENFVVSVLIEFKGIVGVSAGQAWQPIGKCVCVLPGGHETIKTRSTALSSHSTPFVSAGIRFSMDLDSNEHKSLLETAYPKIVKGQITSPTSPPPSLITRSRRKLPPRRRSPSPLRGRIRRHSPPPRRERPRSHGSRPTGYLRPPRDRLVRARSPPRYRGAISEQMERDLLELRERRLRDRDRDRGFLPPRTSRADLERDRYVHELLNREAERLLALERERRADRDPRGLRERGRVRDGLYPSDLYRDVPTYHDNRRGTGRGVDRSDRYRPPGYIPSPPRSRVYSPVPARRGRDRLPMHTDRHRGRGQDRHPRGHREIYSSRPPRHPYTSDLHLVRNSYDDGEIRDSRRATIVKLEHPPRKKARVSHHQNRPRMYDR